MGSGLQNKAGKEAVMTKKRQRCVLELILGLLLTGAIAGALIWQEYQSYLANLSVTADIISSKDPKERTFEILKEDQLLSKKEIKEILGAYGYDTFIDSRAGKLFIKNSIGILVGAMLFYLGYTAVVFCEAWRSRKKIEDYSKKVSDALAKIREGEFRQDVMDWYAEDENRSRILDELDSLGSYVEIMEEQARQEKEETKTLVTDLSHQLKTPVAALGSCFEILKNPELTQGERKEFEGRMEQQLKSLGQLIEALINISRMETGLITLNLQNADLFDTILDAVNRIWVKAGTKEIKLELDAEDEIEHLVIRHDPKWLCEALINLLDNAVKYSPPKTTIKIGVVKMISFVRLEVKDEGIGIAKENFHRVFQRFYRGKEEEVQKEEGAGVGLYLARRIVEGHHGTLSLDTGQMKKSRGSVFVVKIPYQ